MVSSVMSSSTTPAFFRASTSGLKPRRLHEKMALPLRVSRRETPMISSTWSRCTSKELLRMRWELENVGTSQKTRSQRLGLWRCSLM